jgi:predicted phosphodiesterase
MALADIIGAPGVAEIQSAGAFRFQSTGDTGRTNGNEQQQVADAMGSGFDVHQSGKNPAVFFHLGDVIYGHTKDALYRDEFYRPYHRYPAKIIAVPGNHDGETFKTTDPKALAAFIANFCAPTATVPPQASGAGIFRETMTQPGVYWMLDAPFADVIGLYSNIAEGPGNLEGANGDTQQIDWLNSTLKAIAAARKGGGPRKALIIGVHHPPFSSAGHNGSPDMLKQIDDACTAAGIGPDAVLAGHSHTYQRYTRTHAIGGKTVKVPYIVAGCGGHADQPVGAAGSTTADHKFEHAEQGYGYLDVQVTSTSLNIDFHLVLGPHGAAPAGGARVIDSVRVNLATGSI